MTAGPPICPTFDRPGAAVASRRVTTPPDMDPAVARLLERRAPAVVSAPALWREPIRFVLLAATAVIAVTTNLPWLHQEGIGIELVLTGNSGLADGTLLTIVAIATSLLITNRDADGSRTWLLRWLPAILGVVGLLFVLSAARNMELQIQIWRRYGATGVYEPGFFAFVARGSCSAVIALWLGVRRGDASTTAGRPNERLVVRRAGLLAVLASVAGVVVGTLIGGAVALSLDVDPAAVGVPLLALSVLGGAVGGVLASRLAGMLLEP